MTVSRVILQDCIASAVPLMASPALDIGGERVSSRPSFNRGNLDWVLLNLSEKVRPDVVGNILSLPFPDNCFQTIVMFEVLEHLSQPEDSLAEATRVLMPDGRLFLSAPFLYRHHRDPVDFQRWTHEKFFALLEDELGLLIEVFVPRGAWLSVIMDLLGQGLQNLQGAHGGVREWIMASFCRHLRGLIFKSFPLWRKWDQDLAYGSKARGNFYRYTLGYFIVAKKPSATDSAQRSNDVERDVLRWPKNFPGNE